MDFNNEKGLQYFNSFTLQVRMQKEIELLPKVNTKLTVKVES